MAEASHLGLGWAGVASPWRQCSEAPLELLTEASAHMCVRPGPRAHTRTLHRAHAILLHLRSYLIVDVTPWRRWGTTESVSGVRRGTGIQEDQEGQGSSVAPAASEPVGREARSGTPSPIQPVFLVAPFWVRPHGNPEKRGPCPSGQPVSLSGDRDHKHITTQINETASSDQGSGDSVGGSRRKCNESKSDKAFWRK